MRNSSRQFLYLAGAINLILLLVIIIFVWQINQVTLGLMGTADEFASSQLDGESPTETMARLTPRLQSLDNYFLTASTTVDLLERLEQTAKVTQTTLKINQAEAREGLRLEFSVIGNFMAIDQYVASLEKFPYALRIERLSLRFIDKKIWQGDFSVVVAMQKD